MMKTIVGSLFHHAGRDPDGLSLRVLHEGELLGRTTAWSVSDVATRASSAAAWLAAQGLERGDRALLLYMDSLAFAEAFLGCLVAGIVAVPVAPPSATRLDRSMDLLAKTASASGARVLLTSADLAAKSAPLLSGLSSGLRVLATDEASREELPWERALPKAEDVAFLQFTSGSTSFPKGVIVKHRNLSANQTMVAREQRFHSETNLVSWLPTHHDMGLIGDLLMAVWTGRPITLMTPTHFIERPARWLEAISGQPAVRSGGPNFAYALLLRKLAPEAVQGLDLSGWETAFCGAEPVRHEVLRAFTELAAPAGFRPGALSPSYGLAEATVYANCDRPWANGFDSGPAHLDGFTSCGRTSGEVELAIVEEGARQADGVEGEIWLRGPNIAEGYWEAPEATKAVFGGEIKAEGGAPWLRTGDLGRVVDGSLYVTGRQKDLIIQRGQNIYPQDIEFAIEACHPAVRPGCSAAFALASENGTESVGLAVEVRKDALGASEVLNAVTHAVRGAVGARLGVTLSEVWLIAPRALLKTTSGKVMRRPTRAALLDGSLPAAKHSALQTKVPSEGEAMRALLAWTAQATGIPAEEISRDTPLRDMGIDSIRTVELRDHLESVLQTSFHMKEVGAEATLGSISALLRGFAPAPGRADAAAPAEAVRQKSESEAPVLPKLDWMRKR